MNVSDAQPPTAVPRGEIRNSIPAFLHGDLLNDFEPVAVEPDDFALAV